jgi:hypothetical protein
VRAPAFQRVLSDTIHDQWFVSIAMPFELIAIGFFLLRSNPRIERLVVAVTAAMLFITVAVNVVVVPAIAGTLSLKGFADHAMKVIDGNRVGYLNALNYDVAFYSRRIIPIVSLKDPNLPEYLIVWKSLFDALPEAKRNRFDVVMASNPTSLDGSGEMILLHEHPTAPKPLPKATEGYIESMALRQLFLANLTDRADQPRQHLRRSAAQTEIANRRNF